MLRGTLMVVLLLAAGCAAFDAGNYDHSAVLLTDRYELHWTVDEDAGTIALAVRAETDGWVGFGLGEPGSGSMPGADIMVGSVDDASGEVTVTDRYATQKSYPPEDDCNAWTIVGGEQTGGWTTIEVTRDLSANGDLQDRDFLAGSVKVIWAFSATGSDSLDYHDSNRGPSGVTFFGGETGGLSPIEVLAAQPNVEQHMFPNNWTITSDITYYHEAVYNIPEGLTAHMVAYEHVILPETTRYVHHFVIFGCWAADGAEPCDMLWAWAPGVAPLVLPEEAGFRVGSLGYPSLKQQTHYDNPDGSGTGLVDTSGVKLYYTTDLRAHDAVALTVGDVGISQPKAIPAGSGKQFYHYDCPAQCTNLWPEPINVFGAFLHMHQVGSEAVVAHYRGGERLDDLARVEFWDFAFQTTLLLDTQILPGDELRTSCSYKKGSSPVIFQDASDDEMCLHFLYVWPKPPTTACGYLYNEAQLRNFTYCTGLTDYYYNPVVKNPDSILDVTFGTPGTVSCPAPTTTATGATESTTGPATTGSSSTSGTAGTTGTEESTTVEGSEGTTADATTGAAEGQVASGASTNAAAAAIAAGSVVLALL